MATAKKETAKPNVFKRFSGSMGISSKAEARHEIFIREHLKDLNARRSAIAAGYSEKGARVQGVRLLANYPIERVEKTPDLFEKYLPYAMALRVATKWSQAFGNLSVPAPQWYWSNRAEDFHPAHLVDDLGGFSDQAESVLTSRLVRSA